MILNPVDLWVFFLSLATVMGIGLWAARNEETSEDYFLAGRSIRWWGVAGSIFGSNVSANHLVGMLGIGYSIGFAQSHFELGAIAALMLLAYGFLPVYRKLGVFTLSEYLGKRYDGRSQTLYAAILLVVAVVQLTAGLYIGSRSLGLLLQGTSLELGYATGVVILAVITAVYTVVGGLKAVIYTDVIQSVLLLLAGIGVAILTFSQPEVGGWAGMMDFDSARPVAEQKMHLYLPSSHPDLPWSGAMTGLLILHCFYWSTNQTIVQRALAARSDEEARLGIVVAGFLKLAIPFFAIAGGVAAAQLFSQRLPGVVIDPDAATPELIKLVVPAGYGLVGIVMAGLIGAILSSIDSLVNSAATLFTFDLYKRFWRPDAGDRECLVVGRVVLAILLAGSAALALATYDPTGGGNFFLRVSSQAGNFTPGLVVAFALGMFWGGARPLGSFLSISLAPIFSFSMTAFYAAVLGKIPAIESLFGSQLNFLHRVLLTVIFAVAVHWIVSGAVRRSENKKEEDRKEESRREQAWKKRATPGEAYTIRALSFSDGDGAEDDQRNGRVLARLGWALTALAVILLVIGVLVHRGLVPPTVAAVLGAALAWLPFWQFLPKQRFGGDIWWSGLLCSATLFILFYWF